MKKNKLRRGKSSIYNAKTGKNTEDHLIQHFYSFDETNHGPDKWNGPSHGVMDGNEEVSTGEATTIVIIQIKEL